MKVAIALDEGSEVSRHFGRTSHYLIASIENSAIIGRDVRNAHRLHGTGDAALPHHHAHEQGHSEILKELSDCNAVICGGIGPRAVHDLNAHGVQVYITDHADPEMALQQLTQGKLAVASPDRSCQCHE
jgi:predicted Fe-Mo cluster-binding NifX family protein